MDPGSSTFDVTLKIELQQAGVYQGPSTYFNHRYPISMILTSSQGLPLVRRMHSEVETKWQELSTILIKMNRIYMRTMRRGRIKRNRNNRQEVYDDTEQSTR